jgi:predicted house-cleaning NTP pyrophosphatase (Maf/HAM1 superfamily)
VLPLRSTPGRIDVDETPLPEEPAADYVLRLARAKARPA